MADVDSTSVTLLWAPPPGKPVIGYRIECRPIGEQKWFAATDDLITDNQFLGELMFHTKETHTLVNSLFVRHKDKKKY